MSQRIHGNLSGLGAIERAGLERLYHHPSEARELASDALVQRMVGLAVRIGRQVGVLIDRRGEVTHVLCGDDHELLLPDLGRWGAESGRLRGLRLVHVHLKNEPLSEDDQNDLARLGLDLICAVTHRRGVPDLAYVGHLAADSLAADHKSVRPVTLLAPMRWPAESLDVQELLKSLDEQLGRTRPAGRVVNARETALLIHVGPESRTDAEDSLNELEELARTARVQVVGRVIQRKREVDARTLLGAGKLSEIKLKAMQTDATLLIFDRELSPSQAKAISIQADSKVLDRSQLILDIFAGRAKSADGRLQVELAQLRYSLPRLGDRDNALSRLTGGIGAIGPAETKLEVDRRRARERIHRIEEQLKKLRKDRATRRKGRTLNDTPSAALVGYTNVGKSSLLNALAKSDAYIENLLFATLDPTSRRVRMPEGTTVVLTDTVGFIRDLPKELLGAFEATLEEAQNADLLLIVCDASHPQLEAQLRAVERILSEHDMAEKARLVVLNKCDAIDDPATVREVASQRRALLTSSVTREGLPELMATVEAAVLAARQRVPHMTEIVEEWTPHDAA